MKQITNVDLARCLDLQLGRYKFEGIKPRAAIDKGVADLSEMFKDSSHDETGLAGFEPCDGYAESSAEDVCMLNTSSFTSADNLPVASAMSDGLLVGETDGTEDAVKCVDSDVDPLQYVLPNDSSVDVASHPLIDDQTAATYEPMPFSAAEAPNVFVVEPTENNAAASDELVNVTDASTDDCLRQLNVLPQSGVNSADELELLADSFVSTNSMVFCSEGHICKELNSSSCCAKTCNQDGSCNGECDVKIRSDLTDDDVDGDFRLLNSDADQMFMSDGARLVGSSGTILQDVGSDEASDNNMSLDVVEALFAREDGISSRT